MSRLEVDPRPGIDRESDSRYPADQPELWAVVRHCHHARLNFPDGPEYRRLIVEYRTDGETITVELPLSHAGATILHERLINLEILDEYLSLTAERVYLTGHAAICAPTRPVTGGPSWATAGSSLPTIVVTRLCVDRDQF
ncbi:MAG TPA: hypothetical protein VFP34_03445 [Microlunatus sp.]|nr:hypothetical protein [Microlunatus sp.]